MYMIFVYILNSYYIICIASYCCRHYCFSSDFPLSVVVLLGILPNHGFDVRARQVVEADSNAWSSKQTFDAREKSGARHVQSLGCLRFIKVDI